MHGQTNFYKNMLVMQLELINATNKGVYLYQFSNINQIIIDGLRACPITRITSNTLQ